MQRSGKKTPTNTSNYKKKSQPPNLRDVKRPAIQQELLFLLRIGLFALSENKVRKKSKSVAAKQPSQAKFGSLQHLNELVAVLWGKKMRSLLIKRIASPTPNEFPKKVARIPKTNVKKQIYHLLI